MNHVLFPLRLVSLAKKERVCVQYYYYLEQGLLTEDHVACIHAKQTLALNKMYERHDMTCMFSFMQPFNVFSFFTQHK